MKTRLIPLKIRILILLLLTWKVIRTDWIVVTDYECMGSPEVRTYCPPVSPLWDPPRPQDIEPLAESWNHFAFFYQGGAGGPTGDPKLTINFLTVSASIIFGFITGCVLLWISNWIAIQIRWYRDFS